VCVRECNVFFVSLQYALLDSGIKENVPGRVKIQEQAVIKYPACRATSDRQDEGSLAIRKRATKNGMEEGGYKIE